MTLLEERAILLQIPAARSNARLR